MHIILFLIMHIAHFWVPSRITKTLEEVTYSSSPVPLHNLYARMIEVFQNPVVVILYVIGCISLAWHLIHGFQSAFRTLGVSNKKYLALLNSTGIGFSIIVSLLFALMPVSAYLGWVTL